MSLEGDVWSMYEMKGSRSRTMLKDNAMQCGKYVWDACTRRDWRCSGKMKEEEK